MGDHIHYQFEVLNVGRWLLHVWSSLPYRNELEKAERDWSREYGGKQSEQGFSLQGKELGVQKHSSTRKMTGIETEMQTATP